MQEAAVQMVAQAPEEVATVQGRVLAIESARKGVVAVIEQKLEGVNRLTKADRAVVPVMEEMAELAAGAEMAVAMSPSACRPRACCMLHAHQSLRNSP
jgi:hypothetical protein